MKRGSGILSFIFSLLVLLCILSTKSAKSQQLSFTSSGAVINESVVGITLHSLQSNRGSAVHLVNHGNGTLSAAWTHIAPDSFSITRGTGYNFFNGLNWDAFPLQRIEYKRTGWTNIAAANGWEYCMAHSGDSGLFLSKRMIGTGNWQFIHPVGTLNLFTNQNDVWCRFAVGGNNGNSVHVIVNSQGTGTMPVLGQDGPLTYSRSLDGGATWDIDHIQLPMSDSNYFRGFSAENYHIDCRNDVVAIVAGGFDTGIYLWKSVDNGNTWTRTTVFSFPIPFYDAGSMISDINNDGIADTIATGNEDPTVSIDNTGIAHVAFGRLLIWDAVTVDAINYDPLTDGLYYWNENMPAPVVVANAEDFNGNGKIDFPTPLPPNIIPVGRYLGGLIVHPSIGFDNNNDIYLSYASVNEMADTTVYHCMHRHVYIKRSADGGINWGHAINIVPSVAQGDSGEFREAVYPSLAKKVDGLGTTACAHILYQRDPAPYVYENNFGWGFNSQVEWNADANSIPLPNEMIYAKVCNISTGIDKNKAEENSISIFPNPASLLLHIYINNPAGNSERIEIVNPVGKTVLVQPFSTTIDVSKLNQGVYTLNLYHNHHCISKRFVVMNDQ
ncbi:MAG: T9SS type A sorting domain-containing protein [Bacteroidota bacterium]